MVTKLHIGAMSVLVVAMSLCATHSAIGQLQERPLQANANLIIEGRVENVYQGRQSNDEYLVQVLVRRSEALRLEEAVGSTRFPAPGEFVYAHVTLPASNLGRDAQILPQPNTYIRAYLRIGDRNRWEGTPGWFQEASELQGRGELASSNQALGISAERVSLGLKSALKVVQVTPDSPAAKAGIEIGDILVKANSTMLTSPEQLATEFLRSDGRLTLTVRDVRTGRDVLVDVESDPGANMRRESSRRMPLGVTTEVAFYGGNAALKVTKVESGSPAQRAGIVPGLLILTANGQRVEKPDMLLEADRNTTGTLKLRVVDPKSREESLIEIK
jgi:hypothetical protein